MQLWEQDPHVPEYLNGLRDCQKKAKRAGLPFLDDLLAAIAYYSLLKPNSFPKGRPKWDGKIPKHHTLHSWEDYLLPLHKVLEQESRLATGRSDIFGSTHSSALVHDISPPTTSGTPGSHISGAPASFRDQFDGHFSALSAAANGITAVMESLAAATTTQYKNNLASMAELKTLSIASSAMTGGGTRDSATGRTSPNKRTKSNLCINQLLSEIKGKWVPGGFCSTHGHGVGPGHSSKTCNNKTKEGETGGHNNSATRAHPSGLGQNKNKD